MAHDPDSAHAEAEDSHKDRVREERVRDERGVGARLGGAVRETVVVLAMALTLSFVVKTFLIQAFFIPSESMQNTLLVGDRVVVSKLTPGPFELKRGDIVVFADPGDWLSPTPVTNRGAVLNGLPGDHVQCCDAEGRLLVNGEPIEESAYLKPGVNPSDMEFDITVPSGRMWVMGDNRSDSSDSRYHDPGGTGSDGSVPLDLVVGKAVVTVWPFDRAGRLSTHEDVFSQVPDAGSNRSLGLPVREPHSS